MTEEKTETEGAKKGNLHEEKGVIRGIGTRDIHEETECRCCEDTACVFNNDVHSGRTVEEKGS